jgi:hypothetical protein
MRKRRVRPDNMRPMRLKNDFRLGRGATFAGLFALIALLALAAALTT